MRVLLPALWALIATGTIARSACSQADVSSITVSGTVIDSLSRTAVAGAVVQLLAADDPAKLIRSVTSDSLGRFELVDLAVGHYSLGFIHPLLDSLGIDVPSRDLYVTESGPRYVVLAVPSAATVIVAVCGHPRDSSGAVIGMVRDHARGAPVIGATVQVEWIEFVLNPTGFGRRTGGVKATSDENGWFAACNLPNAGTIGLTASHRTESTGQIELQIPIQRLIRRDFYLGPTAPGPITGTEASATVSGRPAHSGNGRISGMVVAVSDRKPIAGAFVSMVDGPETRTNERGEWTLAEVPFGTQMLDIRALGYLPQRQIADVVQGASPIRVELSTLKAVLDTVKITARRTPPDPDGFARRQRIGGGHFLSPSDIARFPVVQTSDLFRIVPGVRTILRDGQKFIQLRGTFEEWCSPAIFVDSHNMSFMTGADIDDYVSPDRVKGIEVYTGAVVPPQFQVGLRGCGSIVIWTR